jgi:hypothetical protein
LFIWLLDTRKSERLDQIIAGHQQCRSGKTGFIDASREVVIRIVAARLAACALRIATPSRIESGSQVDAASLHSRFADRRCLE